MGGGEEGWIPCARIQSPTSSLAFISSHILSFTQCLAVRALVHWEGPCQMLWLLGARGWHGVCLLWGRQRANSVCRVGQ